MERLDDILKRLPKSQFEGSFARLKEFRRTAERSIIVLDDDPTGCQTLHGIPAFFKWDPDILEKELSDGTPIFFLMTNSRSMTEEEAVALYKEIGVLLKKASESTGRPFTIVSRSDSTLRGHYPAEPEALHFLYDPLPLHCIIPAFFQGGRYTCDDEHYVRTGEILVPASNTPFAEDKVFGFSQSNLPGWVEEKTDGRVTRDKVISLSLEDLRTRGPVFVESTLCKLHPGTVVVVNAMEQNDLDIFALGAFGAEIQGVQILYRTAASVLNSLATIPTRPPLPGAELASESDHGGLFIVGSFVPRSTEQLHHLLQQPGIQSLELDVPRILSDTSRDYISGIIRQVDSLLLDGSHTALYTSRELVHTENSGENFAIGKKVSDALVRIILEINNTPAFLVAKGGITSHDIASRGLEMKRAMVAGQALPGVPVLVPDDRPGLRYIVFPGNVGENDALTLLFQKLTAT